MERGNLQTSSPCVYGQAIVLQQQGVRNCDCIKLSINLDHKVRLAHTLLQRTLYSKGSLCKVTSCSKEQFASNWLVTVCSLTHFTPQHTLPPGMFFSSAQFASQHSLLPKTPCSLTHFASQHTQLLSTLCSSAHFASKNTLLLGTLYSSTHFAS